MKTLTASNMEFDTDTEDFSDILDRVQRQRPDLLLAVGRIQNDLALAGQLVERGDSLGAVAVVATPIQQFQDTLCSITAPAVARLVPSIYPELAETNDSQHLRSFPVFSR